MSNDRAVSFPQFSLFPLEIRRQIWRATLRGKLLRVCVGPQRLGSAVWQWSPHKNPVALCVCLESRECALSRYTVKIPVAAPGTDDDGPHFAARYVDPDRDLVMVDPLLHPHYVYRFSFERLNKVRDLYCGSVDRQIRRSLRDKQLSQEVLHQTMVARSQEVEKMVFGRVLIPQSWWPTLLASISQSFRNHSTGDIIRAPRDQNGSIRYQHSYNGSTPPRVLLLDFFREIYVVAEPPTTQEQQGHAGDASETPRGRNLDCLLSRDAQEGLEEWGWKVERIEDVGAIVLSHAYLRQTTRIQDLFYAEIDGIDLDLDERPPAQDIWYSFYNPWLPPRPCGRQISTTWMRHLS